MARLDPAAKGASAVAKEADVGGGGDHLRSYFRQIGNVPLLTREGEVAIAKRIEAAERLLLKTILGCRYGRAELARLEDGLRSGAMRIVGVTRHEADPDPECEAQEQRRVLDLLASFLRPRRPSGLRSDQSVSSLDALISVRLSNERVDSIVASIHSKVQELEGRHPMGVPPATASSRELRSLRTVCAKIT